MVARAQKSATRTRRNTNPAPVKKAPAKSAPVVVEMRPPLSVGQVADFFQMSTRTVRRMIVRGELRTIKVGGKRLIPAAVLDEILETAS